MVRGLTDADSVMAASASPHELLGQALRAQRDGRVQDAIGLYRHALRVDPGNPEAHLGLGILLNRQGHVVEALASLELATQLLPQSVEAWLALGNALARQSRMDAAAAAFARAAELRPDLAAVQVNLGNAQRRLARLKDAVASYRRAIAIDPGLAVAHYNLGIALADQGEASMAEAAFRTALSICPDDLAALNNLGGLHLRQGRYQEALACFERIRAISSQFPRAAYHVGVALQGMRRLAEAVAAYRTALEQEPGDLSALNNLCISLMRNGEYAAALQESDRFLELSPANRKALAYKAAALIELGRRDEARILLDFDCLIQRHRLEAVPGFASVADFNGALAARIQNHPTLRFEPPDKSTRGGSQTGELIAHDEAVSTALYRCVHDAVTAYICKLRNIQPDHAYVSNMPEHWRLATWGVVLRSLGHQGPHFHPDGYISGVYYAALPCDMDPGNRQDGFIEFGRTESEFGGSQPPLLELVRPEEGLMLLFPSYFFHRTLPFESTEPRISVAFDVVPMSPA